MAELGGEALLLQVLHHGFAPEQVYGHAGGQETLVLLPLQRLEGGTDKDKTVLRTEEEVTAETRDRE